MTMLHPVHPHSERLAALAGDDPEATGSGSLMDHVAGCERCSAVVDDLRLLRSSLAELPDLRPSRSIQLLPPVPAMGSFEGPADGGPLGWLRRLAAPAMVAGAGLALIGAVGVASMGLGAMASGGAPIFQNVGQDLADDRAEGAAEPGEASGDARSDGDGSSEEQVGSPLMNFSTPLPWLLLLVIGVAFLVAGLVLRFTIQPRAG